MNAKAITQSMPSILLTALAGILLAPNLSHAEMRDFKSTQGSVIRAELKKAKGQMIILRKEDGKEIQVSLANFSKEDQNYILKWIVEDPAALDYNFVVKADEKLLTSTKKAANVSYERVSSVEKNYSISVMNSCRNAVDDLSIDWCAFMLDKVSLSTYGSSTYSSNGLTGQLRVKKGSESYPKMEASHSVSFSTASFPIDSSIDKYNTGQKSKDKMQGVWLRFYRGDTMVFEWKSPDCPKTEWPGGKHKSKKVPDNIASNTSSSERPMTKPEPETITKPENTGTAVKPSEEEMGDIVKIFQLEDGK